MKYDFIFDIGMLTGLGKLRLTYPFCHFQFTSASVQSLCFLQLVRWHSQAKRFHSTAGGWRRLAGFRLRRRREARFFHPAGNARKRRCDGRKPMAAHCLRRPEIFQRLQKPMKMFSDVKREKSWGIFEDIWFVWYIYIIAMPAWNSENYDHYYVSAKLTMKIRYENGSWFRVYSVF